MGSSSSNDNSFLGKGQGLRILSVKLNSPFDGKVEPFFDFILDIILKVDERSPKQILDKLSDGPSKPKHREFLDIINANEDKPIELKIVSTKTRNVRSVEITPNKNWNGSHDLIGIETRKQKFDEAFDTYVPIVDIGMGSPIQQAGIQEKQYLLGCSEFKYVSLNGFIEMLYDRYFDKEVKDKHIHLAVYDMLHDEVSLKPVLLKRGWGGKGLLGCEFLQGQLYKFPHNLAESRERLLNEHKVRAETMQIKNQLQESDGASRTLVEALKNKTKVKRAKHMQVIKNMISIPVPEIPPPTKMMESEGQHSRSGQISSEQSVRIEILERKVTHLESTLMEIRHYLDEITAKDQDSDATETNRPRTMNKYVENE